MALSSKFGVNACKFCLQKGLMRNSVFSQVRVISSSSRILLEKASVGVDIGVPAPQRKRREIRRARASALRELKSSQELEAKARHRTLDIPLDVVKKVWEETSGPHQIRQVASHYGIFDDLFDGAHFTPYTTLRIMYGQMESQEICPVYRGNVITPSEATEVPDVSFEAADDTLWTLLLTNPDGHLLDNEAEYAHWLIGNIPGGNVKDGELLLDYLPPFPARGSGYQRLVFLLYKQDGRIDFNMDTQLPCNSLADRTFSTLEFYKKHQDVMTPAGLAFFQSRWDPSVQHTYHHILKMREPVFEYDPPKQHIAPQVKWPHKKPIWYLNKYLPKN